MEELLLGLAGGGGGDGLAGAAAGIAEGADNEEGSHKGKVGEEDGLVTAGDASDGLADIDVHHNEVDNDEEGKEEGGDTTKNVHADECAPPEEERTDDLGGQKELGGVGLTRDACGLKSGVEEASTEGSGTVLRLHDVVVTSHGESSADAHATNEAE